MKSLSEVILKKLQESRRVDETDIHDLKHNITGTKWEFKFYNSKIRSKVYNLVDALGLNEGRGFEFEPDYLKRRTSDGEYHILFNLSFRGEEELKYYKARLDRRGAKFGTPRDTAKGLYVEFSFKGHDYQVVKLGNMYDFSFHCGETIDSDTK